MCKAEGECKYIANDDIKIHEIKSMIKLGLLSD